MHSSTSRALALPVAGLAVALGVAACGSSSGSPVMPAAASSSAGTTARQGGQRTPATTGLVAAITGTTLQVQTATTQTAVTYTATTRFTKSMTLPLAQITAGECATVTGTASGGAFTARAVRISPNSASGTCTAAELGGRGFGGRGLGGSGFGGRSAGGGTGTPASSAPSGAPGGRGRFPGAVLTGTVSAVSASGLVVAGTVRTLAAGTSSSAAATVSTTVATTSTTTITQNAIATATTLAVGQCVTAIGPTGSTGTVTARTIAISSPVNGTCAAGFRGGFGARGGAGGQSGTTGG